MLTINDVFNTVGILFDPSLNWLPFLGSILGGLFTLGGVFITIKYNEKKDKGREKKEAEPLICLEIVNTDTKIQENYSGSIIYTHDKAPFHNDLLVNRAVIYPFSSEKGILGGIVIHNVGIKPALNLKFTIDLIPNNNKNREEVGLKVSHAIGVIYGEKKYTMVYTIDTFDFYLWNAEWCLERNFDKFTFDYMIRYHNFFRIDDINRKKELFRECRFPEQENIIYSIGTLRLEYEDILHNKYLKEEKIAFYIAYFQDKHLKIKWEIIQ